MSEVSKVSEMSEIAPSPQYEGPIVEEQSPVLDRPGTRAGLVGAAAVAGLAGVATAVFLRSRRHQPRRLTVRVTGDTLALASNVAAPVLVEGVYRGLPLLVAGVRQRLHRSEPIPAEKHPRHSRRRGHQ